MRLWMVDPQLLCRQHLLGEHVETHMFRGAMRRGASMAGYVAGGLLDSRALAARHDALAAEMERRGYRHRSQLQIDYDPEAAPGVVDAAQNRLELARRCRGCLERQVTLEARYSA